MGDDDDWEEEYFEEVFDDEELGFECPAGPGGWRECPLAGTEECDWDCTQFSEERIAAMKAAQTARAAHDR